MEVDGEDQPIRSYAWGLDLSGRSGGEQGGGGVGGLCFETEHATNVTYHASFDSNGNLTSLRNPVGGTGARYEYGPFGESFTARDALAGTNPFRFSTKYTDADTGLVDYGYRYYNASLGRWLNRDPIGERGGINTLAFVGNDPVLHIDFLGLVWRFEPEPSPIITRPVLPMHEREFTVNGVLYVTNGKWDSDWNFHVTTFELKSGCCIFSITGSPRNRWTWYVPKAMEEELRELRIDETYWRDFARGVNAWKWAAELPSIPCDVARVASPLLENAAKFNQHLALAEINTRDMLDHPNPSYQKSLDFANSTARQAKDNINRLTKQLESINREYDSGKRKNCCK
jgi:RHS repeat-associated protein